MTDPALPASTRATLIVIIAMVVALLGLPGCGEGDGGDGNASPAPFELSTSPQFVNMVIPGRRPVGLVTAAGGGTEAIDLDATTSIDGALIEFVPDRITPGEVAEIWVELPGLTEEIPLRITITGTRGAEQRTITVDATAMPGTDDLEPTALDIAAVFVDELAGAIDGLPSTTSRLVNGTPVAGLLVVSHYAWFTDDAEIGLAWHIMVAPDDWAELTIRPRDGLAPTRAFRLNSWSTALTGGEIEIIVIDPPPEVTR